MVEINVYFLAVCAAFIGLGIPELIETVINFIKKRKWCSGAIYIVLLVILYFVAVEVFKCILK